MRPFVWLLRILVFFALFAFALNNQQEVAVNWFFGFAWHAPMVVVVLVAFAAGCAIGVLAMVPAWWRRRSAASAPTTPVDNKATASPATPVPSQFGAEAAMPPREGW